jgi:hypothetical protein
MEPYRDGHRSCPRCQSGLRVFHDRLVCDACGGVMLSFDEVRGAIEELTGLAPTLSYRNESPGKLPCPQCSTAMSNVRLTLELEGMKPVKPKAKLDRCATHGLWFDDVELALVLEPVASKGFGGGRAHTRSARDRHATPEVRSFNFKIGGRGWGM